MDARIAGESLLRAYTLMIPSLRPSTSIRSTLSSPFARTSIASKKTFSSRSISYAENDSPKPNDSQQTPVNQSKPEPPSSGASTGTRFSDRLGSVFGQEFSPPSSGSSIDDLRRQFLMQGSGSRGPRPSQGNRVFGSIDTSGMAIPKSASDFFNMPPIYQPAADEPLAATIKLGPSVGRTVSIDRGVDLGRGFMMLNSLCARNQVSRQARQQRFHERPGLKRKRLKSERWRNQFKEGFTAIVGSVNQMRRQGW